VRRVRTLLAAAASAWLILLAAAPSAALGVPASGATYLFGSFVCHQRAGRSFHLAAAQLPVCARCLGLYAGAMIGLLVWRAPSRERMRIVLLAAAGPTALTWAAEAIGLWDPGNAVRFGAALPLGAAAALTVNYVECARRRPSGSRPPATPI
jgi:uncharacterized membrane protein